MAPRRFRPAGAQESALDELGDRVTCPADGGQAPYTIYRLALASGLYEELPRVETLGLLRRIA